MGCRDGRRRPTMAPTSAAPAPVNPPTRPFHCAAPWRRRGAGGQRGFTAGRAARGAGHRSRSSARSCRAIVARPHRCRRAPRARRGADRRAGRGTQRGDQARDARRSLRQRRPRHAAPPRASGRPGGSASSMPHAATTPAADADRGGGRARRPVPASPSAATARSRSTSPIRRSATRGATTARCRWARSPSAGAAKTALKVVLANSGRTRIDATHGGLSMTSRVAPVTPSCLSLARRRASPPIELLVAVAIVGDPRRDRRARLRRLCRAEPRRRRRDAARRRTAARMEQYFLDRRGVRRHRRQLRRHRRPPRRRATRSPLRARPPRPRTSSPPPAVRGRGHGGLRLHRRRTRARRPRCRCRAGWTPHRRLLDVSAGRELPVSSPRSARALRSLRPARARRCPWTVGGHDPAPARSDGAVMLEALVGAVVFALAALAIVGFQARAAQALHHAQFRGEAQPARARSTGAHAGGRQRHARTPTSTCAAGGPGYRAFVGTGAAPARASTTSIYRPECWSRPGLPAPAAWPPLPCNGACPATSPPTVTRRRRGRRTAR